MPQPSTAASSAFHALIKTHHITSRKKVSIIRAAAVKFECYALLRSGGVPGVMYVEGSEEGVSNWVDTVHSLRYKDYQLIARPSPISEDQDGSQENGNNSKGVKKESITTTGLRETGTLKEFAAVMEEMGFHTWFRKAMGYISS